MPTTLLFLGGPNWPWVSYLGILGWVPLGGLSAWIILTDRLGPAVLAAPVARHARGGPA